MAPVAERSGGRAGARAGALGRWLGGALLLSVPALALGQGLPAITVNEDGGGTQYSLTLQLLALMTLLSVLPGLLLAMTSFVRIVIVLSLLRQALGTAQTPPNQVLVGIALFLTFMIMAPTFTQVFEQGVRPYLDQEIAFDEALERGSAPMRAFMLAQTREQDLLLFFEIAGEPAVDTPEAVPFYILVPAFLTSELKSAFTIGFLIYIPFVILDLVVASVLMSMGMMMLSPMMISMPFKLMLFVLVDGWSLIMGSLAGSFVTTGG